MFSLDGKVSIVTGGSRGLGKGIAHALLKAGSKVVVVGRDKNRLGKTVDEFKNDGLLAFGYQCDVGKRDEIDKLFEYVNNDFGRIDVLVNNAGVTQSAPLTEYPDEIWWQTLSGAADPVLLNVVWLFLTCADFDTDPVWNFLITLVPCAWERPSKV